MKKLMFGAAAAALLAACGGNGGDGEAAIEQAAEAAKREIIDVASLTPRGGDASEAAAALTAMNLDTSGTGIVTFANKSVNGATATFTDVSIEIEDGDQPSVTAGTLTLEGLETTESGEASFGLMKLADITIPPSEGEGDTVTTIKGLSLVNPSPATAGYIAKVLGGGDHEAVPDAEGLSFEGLALDTLLATISDEDGTSGTFGIETVNLGAQPDENVGSAVLEGMKLDIVDGADGQTAKMNLDNLTIAGADLKLLEAVRDNVDDEEAMATALSAALYDNPIDPGFDSMSLSNFTFDIAGADFALPSMNYVVARNDAGEPTRLSLEPMTMTLSADPEGGEAGSELAGALGMIGYETIELNAAGASTYDPETDILTYEAGENYFGLADGFTLNTGGKIEGYKAYSASLGDLMADPAALENGDPTAMMGAFSSLVVHNFELQFDDNSFVDRMFNLAAAQSGEDPAQLRNQAVMMTSMAPMMAAGAGIDGALATEFAGAISSFLSEPGTLTLKVAPETPLNIGALIESGDPSSLTKDSLGFSASNE
ncbi:MAG: hypothetical protein AAFY37_06350 [Pseudomonadota bacterium]